MCASITRTMDMPCNAFWFQISLWSSSYSASVWIDEAAQWPQTGQVRSRRDSAKCPWKPLQDILETVAPGNMLHLQVKCPNHQMLKPEMWYQKTFTAPGLSGIEVQPLDGNQHGAGQGLYRLLWPTSVQRSLTPHQVTSWTQTSFYFSVNRHKWGWMTVHSQTVIILINSFYSHSAENWANLIMCCL